MAETILLIHGMCSGPWVWDNYQPAFESWGCRCVTPALRYHDVDPRGPPPPELGTTSLLDYAADLVAEVERLDAAPVLVGHSLGGLLAQIVAARVPCKALVLLGPAPPAGILAFRPGQIRGFGSVLLRWGWWKAPIRHTFREATYSMLNGLPPEAQRQVYGRFVYESGRAAFEAGLWFLDARKAARVDVSRVTCPVLLLAGAQDRLAPASVMRSIAKLYAPNCETRTLDGHAHWLTAEPGWPEVAAAITRWLDQVL